MGWASLVVQMVKNLSAMRETWVKSLGREDPLEKGMAIHSCILAWKILGNFPGEGNGNPLMYSCLWKILQRSLEGYGPWGRKELDRSVRLTFLHHGVPV